MEQAEQGSLNTGRKGEYARKRVIFLVLGSLSLLLIGVINAWSIFSEPICGDMGWNTQDMSKTFLISIIAFCVGCLLSSVVQTKCKGEPRVPIVLGAVLMAAGFLAAAYAPMGQMGIFLFYGVVAGLGEGFAFNAIIPTVNLWFPDRVGIASGVQMFCYTSSPLFLGIPLDSVMSAVGWRAAFVGLAVAFLVLLIVCAVVAKMPPYNIGEFFQAPTAANADAVDVAGADDDATGADKRTKNPHYRTDFGVSATSFTMAQAMKSKTFWVGLAWFITVGAVALTLVGESKQDALSLGVATSMATLLAGLVAVGEGCASIVYGFFLDRFGLMNLVRLVTGLAIVATGLITLAFFIGNGTIFFVGAILLTCGYGGLPIFSAAFALNRFGRDYYSVNYAVATTWLSIASVLSMIITPFLLAAGGLLLMYGAFFILGIVGVFIMFAFVAMYRKDMDKLVE
jgi:MFS transporter, OFA family, oxalate/formate antiporter